MPIVCEHEMGHALRLPQPDGSVKEMAACVHCGTTTAQAEKGKGCINRLVADPIPEGGRVSAFVDPEVTRRLRAFREQRHNCCYVKKRPPLLAVTQNQCWCYVLAAPGPAYACPENAPAGYIDGDGNYVPPEAA